MTDDLLSIELPLEARQRTAEEFPDLDTLEHPVAGLLEQIAFPSRSTVSALRCGPHLATLGQYNQEVLASLGVRRGRDRKPAPH